MSSEKQKLEKRQLQRQTFPLGQLKQSQQIRFNSSLQFGMVCGY